MRQFTEEEFRKAFPTAKWVCVLDRKPTNWCVLTNDFGRGHIYCPEASKYSNPCECPYWQYVNTNTRVSLRKVYKFLGIDEDGK